jgi:hypothetical protein
MASHPKGMVRNGTSVCYDETLQNAISLPHVERVRLAVKSCTYRNSSASYLHVNTILMHCPGSNGYAIQ